MFVDEDVHKCGRCQAEFSSLEAFIQHKLQHNCKRQPEALGPGGALKCPDADQEVTRGLCTCIDDTRDWTDVQLCSYCSEDYCSEVILQTCFTIQILLCLTQTRTTCCNTFMFLYPTQLDILSISTFA